MKQSFTRGLVAAALAIGLSAGVADTAMAGGKKGHGGPGVPTQKISVQLWTFAEYVGFLPGPAAVQRTEEVFAKLRSYGYHNVEPFQLSGLTPQQYRALLRQVPPEGARSPRRRRLPDRPAERRPDHRRQQGPRRQVLRLGRDARRQAQHRGRLGRVREVPRRGRREGAPGRPDADPPQPQLGVQEGLQRTHGLRDRHGQHVQEERDLPARPLLGGPGRSGPRRAAQALRQAHPVLPRQGPARRATAGSRSSAAGTSTSRRSSRPPRARSATTRSSTTRASVTPRSTRSRRPRWASTTSTP